MADRTRITIFLYPHQLQWLRRQQRPAKPWLPSIPASDVIRGLIDQAVEQQHGDAGQG
ncbi:MAG: hypothetical protein RLZZ117_1340 [Cyanobacteriota bacterium]|jgi:hypothetical protein